MNRQPDDPRMDHDPPKRVKRSTSRQRRARALAYDLYVVAMLSLAAGACAGIAWWAFRWVLSALP